MESERLNLPTTFSMSLEVMGHELEFSQDPNSKHLGTTVWDASLVFAKFLEKNCRRGRFSPSKLKGKRVIELGAGCGVAGFGMALLGCDVVMTDQMEVLPLLRRNVERNTSRIKQLNPDSFGSIKVAELNWGNDDNIRACGPPFDYIIGTDVVYAEHLLEPLLQTIFALSGPKTTIMVGYEIRSTSVHEQMMNMWKRNFEVKTVPSSKMDDTYQHPSIQLYIMEMKPQLGIGTTESTSKAIDQANDEVETRQDDDENGVGCDEVEKPGVGTMENSSKRIDEVETNLYKVEVGGRCDKVGQAAEVVGEKVEEEGETETRLPKAKLSEWEARRYGSVAARLLQDIKITSS